jgi:hypothetical protein
MRVDELLVDGQSARNGTQNQKNDERGHPKTMDELPGRDADQYDECSDGEGSNQTNTSITTTINPNTRYNTFLG